MPASERNTRDDPNKIAETPQMLLTRASHGVLHNWFTTHYTQQPLPNRHQLRERIGLSFTEGDNGNGVEG